MSGKHWFISYHSRILGRNEAGEFRNTVVYGIHPFLWLRTRQAQSMNFDIKIISYQEIGVDDYALFKDD